MNIFNEILHKVRDKYSPDYDYMLFCFSAYTRKTQTKLQELHSLIENPVPFGNNRTNYTLECFQKSQRIYNGFSKLARIFKYKRSTVKVEHDLYLNPINKQHKNSLLIFQDGCKYWFTLSDLINIIVNSITNTCNFFSNPLECKNPYNNLVFSKAILYNIYFHVKQSNLKMPTLLNQYFACDFELKLFETENEFLIREHSILRYINKSPNDVLLKEIDEMLKVFTRKRIKYHQDFPKDELIEIMRPYLYLHCICKYGIEGLEIRDSSYKLLYNKLMEFQKKSPNFGRRIFKKQPLDMSTPFAYFKKKTKFVETFNREHPKFTITDIKKMNYRVPIRYSLVSTIINNEREPSDVDSDESNSEINSDSENNSEVNTDDIEDGEIVDDDEDEEDSENEDDSDDDDEENNEEEDEDEDEEEDDALQFFDIEVPITQFINDERRMDVQVESDNKEQIQVALQLGLTITVSQEPCYDYEEERDRVFQEMLCHTLNHLFEYDKFKLEEIKMKIERDLIDST
jgi:hypothetical protein